MRLGRMRGRSEPAAAAAGGDSWSVCLYGCTNSAKRAFLNSYAYLASRIRRMTWYYKRLAFYFAQADAAAQS